MSELIKDNAVSAETTKVRYSDEELEEFRTIINDMLDKARKEYNTLRRVIMHNGSNDIEDTTPSFKTVEDDGAYQLSKEEASQLAQRQYKFIQNLRKDSGFEVTDKIGVAIFADGAAYDDIAAALEGYKDYIAAQTLALSVTLGKDAPEGAADVEWDEGSVKMVLSR